MTKTSDKERTLTLLAAVLGIFLALLCGQLFSFAAGAAGAPQRRTRRAAKPAAKPPAINYSQFSHSTHVTKQKLACDSCHKFPSKNWKAVRKEDEAFPDITEFPEHSSCLNCHREQFFARERPAPAICSNCHVAVTPKNTVRFPFPSLGEPFLNSSKGANFVSDFVVGFPHDKHIDAVGLFRGFRRNQEARFARASFRREDSVAADDPKSCPVCHQTYQPQGKSNDEFVTKPPKDLPEDAFWLKKGAFKTTPTTHTICFTCHNTDAELAPLPTNCDGCHKLRPAGVPMQHDFDPKLAATMGIKDPIMLSKWSRRSAGRYRHEYEVHVELSCITCHNPTVMNTLDERTLVTVKSCGGEGSGCHVESNTDGILNFEIEQKKNKPEFQCTKCHIILGKQTVPADHLEALPKPAK